MVYRRRPTSNTLVRSKIIRAEGAMPRFFFALQGGHNVEDEHGLEFEDDLGAFRAARKLACEIADVRPHLSGNTSVVVTRRDALEVFCISVRRRFSRIAAPCLASFATFLHSSAACNQASFALALVALAASCSPYGGNVRSRTRHTLEPLTGGREPTLPGWHGRMQPYGYGIHGSRRVALGAAVAQFLHHLGYGQLV